MSQLDTTMFLLDTLDSALEFADEFPDSIDSIVDGLLRDATEDVLISAITGLTNLSSETKTTVVVKLSQAIDLYDDNVIEAAVAHRLGLGYTFCFLKETEAVPKSIWDLRYADDYVTIGVYDNSEFFKRATRMLCNVNYECGTVAAVVTDWFEKAFGPIRLPIRSIMCPCVSAVKHWGIRATICDNEVIYRELTPFVELLIVVGLAMESGFPDFCKLLAPALRNSNLAFNADIDEL